MAEMKTKLTGQSVEDFLNQLPDEKKRKDSFLLLETMQQAAQAEARMWGDAIIGFGDYHYKYESGRENDWFQVGFSPRKQNLALYLMGGYHQDEDLLAKLGKIKPSKGCMYINNIEDIDLAVLKTLIERSIQRLTTP
jgi:hypothetical protein